MNTVGTLYVSVYRIASLFVKLHFLRLSQMHNDLVS